MFHYSRSVIFAIVVMISGPIQTPADVPTGYVQIFAESEMEIFTQAIAASSDLREFKVTLYWVRDTNVLVHDGEELLTDVFFDPNTMLQLRDAWTRQGEVGLWYQASLLAVDQDLHSFDTVSEWVTLDTAGSGGSGGGSSGVGGPKVSTMSTVGRISLIASVLLLAAVVITRGRRRNECV